MRTLDDVSYAVGWKALANYLSQIGISTSWTALETRARRYGLPSRGRGVRGREIIFSRDDIATWVEHLTGLQLDAWLAKRDAAQDAAGRTAPRRRRRVDRDRNLGSVLQFPVPLFAMTTRSAGFGEQVVRRGGAVLASHSTEPLEDFDPEVLGGAEVGCWRYDVARISTAADLHGPRLTAPQRRSRPAVRLVGALVPGSPEWRWCRVRGEYFGAADRDLAVPFLAADGLPRFAEAISEARSSHGEVAFVTWSRRVAVKPVLFEPIGPPALDVEALIGES